jgi:DNA (cytosine-5)-methyltransferase 1
MFTTGEMFSGIGGFRFGLEKAKSWESRQLGGRRECSDSEGDGEDEQCAENSSFRCVWANDWDKYACQIYRKHYGDKELVEGDIRTIDANTIPDFELLTAGFPCQSFSLAGKRKGFEDTRGTLFYEVARIAEAKRPRLLLLENVKGLLSNDEGRTFATIIQTLDGLGYDVEWQVLNSKYFGVPQNRERVFIVGHLRGTGSRQIFPIGQALANANGIHKKTQEGSRVRVANTLSRRYYKDGGENLIAIGEIWQGSQCRVYDNSGIAPTLHKSGGHTEPLVLAVETAFTKANMKEGRFSKECHSLDGGKSKGVMLLDGHPDGKPRTCLREGRVLDLAFDGVKIRRLTPVECERLQGFPDGWTEGVSDTQRYKLLGNAVTVNVVEFLGWRLRECLS